MDDLPDELRSRAFHVREARGRGIAAAVVRRRGLDRPFRGVRVAAGGAHTLEDRCRAYLEHMPAGHAFTHGTAARLWGLRVPSSIDRDPHIDVSAARPARPPRMRGVRGRQAEELDVVDLNGLPVTSPETTWAALAPLLTLDQLVVCGDGLVARKHPLSTIERLAMIVRSNAGRRGNAKLRTAFALVRTRTDSAAETRLRLLLVRAGLPEPEVNALISRPGARRRWGDLVYRDHRVVVEYEGKHHSEDRETYAADIARAEELSEWRFIKVIAEHDPADVVRRVRRVLSSRRF